MHACCCRCWDHSSLLWLRIITIIHPLSLHPLPRSRCRLCAFSCLADVPRCATYRPSCTTCRDYCESLQVARSILAPPPCLPCRKESTAHLLWYFWCSGSFCAHAASKLVVSCSSACSACYVARGAAEGGARQSKPLVEGYLVNQVCVLGPALLAKVLDLPRRAVLPSLVNPPGDMGQSNDDPVPAKLMR